MSRTEGGGPRTRQAAGMGGHTPASCLRVLLGYEWGKEPLTETTKTNTSKAPTVCLADFECFKYVNSSETPENPGARGNDDTCFTD